MSRLKGVHHFVKYLERRDEWRLYRVASGDAGGFEMSIVDTGEKCEVPMWFLMMLGMQSLGDLGMLKVPKIFHGRLAEAEYGGEKPDAELVNEIIEAVKNGEVDE